MTTVLADDTRQHKPHPEPLLYCLDSMQLAPSDVIYIGDTLSDYEAAKNANIDFGYAKWGSVSDHGIDSPTFISEQPADLLTLLEK